MKKIAKFKTDKEAAKFWETHSFEDYYKDTKDAEIRFSKKPKKTVAIRLDPDDIKSVEKIAELNQRVKPEEHFQYFLRMLLLTAKANN